MQKIALKNINLSFKAKFSSSAVNGSLKKTVFYDFHVANGGKMVDFAHYLMPVQYKYLSIQQSHLHTREKCSLFDVSHMMQTHVYGKDRFKYMERLVVGDVQGLKQDTGTLSVYTNEKGGIIDDLIVHNTSLNKLYVVSNAGCAEKDLAHMRECERQCKKDKLDVNVEVIEDMALIALQGPKMLDVLQPGVKFNLNDFPFMSTTQTQIFSIDNCRVTRCGYTGEDGVEISVPKKHAINLVEVLLRNQNCKLAGLGPRDTLRLEAGLCLYDNDIDDSTSPIEAGLAWLIGKRRRQLRDFPGADVILTQLKEKPLRRRVGLRLLNSSGPSARQHMKVLDGNTEIGEVTSGCPSPSLKQLIAMAYVQAKYATPGTKVMVNVRNKNFEADVVKMPFVPTRYFTKSS